MTTESNVTAAIRLEAAQAGHLLWRNNVGACVDTRGRYIRYGLANESKAINANIKSSDLVGITPVIVTLDMVGQALGVFTAIECKASDWTQGNDARTQAQARFIDLVQRHGGRAGFATSIEDYKGLVK